MSASEDADQGFRWADIEIRPPWQPEAPPAKATLHSWFPPVICQGGTPLCAAAVVTALAAYFARRARDVDVELSVLFNYRMSRILMSEPDRRGAHIEFSIAAWQLFGMPEEDAWPFDVATVDTDPPKLVSSRACSAEVSSWCLRHKEVGAAALLATLRAALRAGVPVACEFPLYISQFAGFATGVLALPRCGEQSVGRHVVLVVGFDDERRELRVRNSWGSEWGDGGYGALPYAYLERGLVANIWLIVESAWVHHARDDEVKMVGVTSGGSNG